MTNLTPTDSQELEQLREQLAAIEHQRWADWQRYVHSLCARLDNGSLVIPAEQVTRWERQIATPYAELSEAEKTTDREQVARYWYLIWSDNNNPHDINDAQS